MGDDGERAGDNGWAQHLGARIEATPLAPCLEVSVRTMGGLNFIDADGRIRKLDFGQVKCLLRRQRRAMADTLRREGLTEADFLLDCALAIYLYTLDMPRIFAIVNRAMYAPERADPTARDGISKKLRKCLPYIKYLRHALLSLPEKYHFSGRCFRGVKWAFPRCGEQRDGSWSVEHDPARHFPLGRQLRWYEFKSASRTHDMMYQDAFCGNRGPRTIFTIEGVRGYIIEPFSAFTEGEILFLPNTQFQVERVQKKLMMEHLVRGAEPGGFPDDVVLVSPHRGVAEAIPRDLLLPLGRQEIDMDAPLLGCGSFAEVRRGSYAFSLSIVPTAVAFKIFRGTQQMNRELRKQIIKEAQLGVRLQQHPNLISLFGVLEIPEQGLSLVLELAEGGSLRQVLSDIHQHPVLPWALRLRWLAEIATGLGVLHSLIPRAVIHRDLKAANVLLSTPLPPPGQLEAPTEDGVPVLNACVAKVADFGIAEIMETMASRASVSGGSSGVAGTLAWKAPETFEGRYTPASDVFGLGVTCFELLSRKHPFEGLTQPEIIERASARFKVQDGMLRFATEEQQKNAWVEDNPLSERRPDLSAVEEGCPEGLLGLLQRCWADEASERPTVEECLAELRRIVRAQQLAEQEADVVAQAQAQAEAAAVVAETQGQAEAKEAAAAAAAATQAAAVADAAAQAAVASKVEAQAAEAAHEAASSEGGGESQPELEHPQAELAAGTTVVIDGLVGAPQHNGKFGVVEDFDAAKGRYVVRVIGDAVTMNLKAAKLRHVAVIEVLEFAAQVGDVAELARLLDGDADPNTLLRTDEDDSTGQKLRTTALIQALEKKQAAAALLLLKRGADPGLADSGGLTPLMAATQSGSLASVRLLLARRVALDCKLMSAGFTAFHFACSKGHADVAEALVRAGCDTTLCANNGRVGREIAMKQKHTAVVRAIDATIPFGATGTAVVMLRLGGAPQHNGKPGVVQDFDADRGRYVVRVIGERITLNLQSINLLHEPAACLLRFAARDITAMGLLLDGGVDPNALVEADDIAPPGHTLQSTALIEALLLTEEAAVQLLLDRGADPNLVDSLGQTPLMAAARSGSLAGVRLLLARRVALDCVWTINGSTAFHCACANGHADIAKALMRAGCDTTLRACRYGIEESRAEDYLTGREMAITKRHTAVVRAIDATIASEGGGESQPELEHPQAELAAGTKVVIDGLMGARQHNGKFGVVEDFDADRGRYVVRVIGQSLRVQAANLQLVPAAQVLLLAQTGNVVAMGQLLDGSTDPNALVQLNKNDASRPGQKLQSTALISALGCRQEAAARLLLEHGADPSLANSMGETPLMAVARAGNLGGVELLLAWRVALNCVQLVTGFTAFHCACNHGYADVAEALMRAGCDTTMRISGIDDNIKEGINGMTGRELAIMKGNTAVVQAINAVCPFGAPGESQPELEHPQAELAAGTTVLIDGLVGASQHNGKGGVVEDFDAAKGRYVVRVIGDPRFEAEPQQLWVKTVNLARLSTNGGTNAAKRTMMFAVQDGNVTAIGQLLDDGTDPDALVSIKNVAKDGSGVHRGQSTALVMALSYEHEAAARLLLERGADPNLVDSVGQSPLMAAAESGSLAGVRLLLARRVALDCTFPVFHWLGLDWTGFTAFHCACINGHADVAVALMRAGCDTTLRAKNGKTGREMAMKQGHTVVVRSIDAVSPFYIDATFP